MNQKTDNTLGVLYVALRAEVDQLAGGKLDAERGLTLFPDPIHLDPIMRRVLVRSVFSFIEGTVYGLKQLASTHSRALSFAERTLAIEESYELKDNGEVITRSARLRFLSNMRFAFKIFAKTEELEFPLDTGSLGWHHLTIALKIRDRLMHPKSVSDLNVTNDEIRTVMSAFSWFDSQVMIVLIKKVLKNRAALKDLQRDVSTSHTA